MDVFLLAFELSTYHSILADLHIFVGLVYLDLLPGILVPDTDCFVLEQELVPKDVLRP